MTAFALFVFGIIVLVCWCLLYHHEDSLLPAYLSGPNATSWLLGNQDAVLLQEAGKANQDWKKRYGNIYKYRSCFGLEFLVLNDPNAIQYVLKAQTTIYPLERSLREFLRLVAGEGLVYTIGEEHGKQKRHLQPAFSTSIIKSFAPVFTRITSRLSKIWRDRIVSEGSAEGTWDTNGYHWMELLMMDSIGLTLFGVDFGALEGGSNDLLDAFSSLISNTFSRPSKLTIIRNTIMLYLPTWLIHVTNMLPIPALRKLQHARDMARKYAIRLIGEKKRQLATQKDFDGNDLLTVLAKATMTSEKSSKEPLSDEQIYQQLRTFFMAAFETTGNSISFALIEIARHPTVQAKLYGEIVSVLGTTQDRDLDEGIDFSAVETMPYLAAVINETLRMHPAVHSMFFQAIEDNLIPLSWPMKAGDGTEVNAIPVKAGQRVMCHFDGFNHLEEVWGPDASKFEPDRWLRKDVSSKLEHSAGGPYENLATFGAGAKGCIGWRVGLLELQVFVAVLVREFDLSISKPDYELWRDGSFVGTIPLVKGELDKGPQVPLRIKRRDARVT